MRHLAHAIEQIGTAKLVRYALLAAEHALASYAPHEALALLDRALSAKEKHAGSTGRADAETAAVRVALSSTWIQACPFGVWLSSKKGVPSLSPRALTIVDPNSIEEGWLITLKPSLKNLAKAAAIAASMPCIRCPFNRHA